MTFHQPGAELFVPDGIPEAKAIARTTHLGIGAHQDDLEFMAFEGILAGLGKADSWFGGITCTNGSGSARTGQFAEFSDEQMMEVRREEQREAARLGEYSFMAQLDYPSAAVKDPSDSSLQEDLAALIRAAAPRVLYTHNPADKHDTHIGVLGSVIRAVRSLPVGERPERVLGCEVWRGLDWMQDADKVVQNVSGHDDFAARLNGLFASQIAGGKRYDLATLGRRRANATFFDSHSVDQADQVMYAMDLTPVCRDDRLDVTDFVLAHIDRFRSDVESKLNQYL